MHDKDNREDLNKTNTQSDLNPEPGKSPVADPQEKMEGPMSSAIHNIGNAFKTDETKEEADEEKDQKM
jgi:hypothetical protein